ncbi:hypothetical protein C1H46_010605 [Malus baccata]|uniref:Uncharacterized protein n=1 Tax=Malus baccata TaxID=106549 RepID=A0A540MYD5_MALBA|nr:hypothetical protein C1H46_010605 [Malus baccata]
MVENKWDKQCGRAFPPMPTSHIFDHRLRPRKGRNENNLRTRILGARSGAEPFAPTTSSAKSLALPAIAALEN